MATGYLALVLHAHLPFVRHPEHQRHLEERWLYEALLECYLPLLDVFDRLAADGVPFALTMSVTPPLASMMKDSLLQERFERHLATLEQLAEQEMKRLWGDEKLAPVATFYRDEARRVRAVWERHERDVLAGFVKHRGRRESRPDDVLGDALLPPRDDPRARGDPAAARAGGARLREGRRANAARDVAAGVRLRPELRRRDRRGRDPLHARRHARDRQRPPATAVRRPAPIVSPNGVAFFGRDAESSRQVWSRDEGYPGDAFYREFYRDIGFDLPVWTLMGEVAGDGSRLMTGLKYFRITGKDGEKQPYQPGVAAERAREHAGNFVFNRAAQMKHLARSMPCPPIVVAPYDAELYGHWWFEGPQFLEHVFRAIHEARRRRGDDAPRGTSSGTPSTCARRQARPPGAPAATARSGSGRRRPGRGGTYITRPAT